MQPFAYAEPRSEEEALSLLSSGGVETEILAGGTDLVPLLNKMVVAPKQVVNIREIPSLQTIDVVEEGALRLGAAVALDDVLAHPASHAYPALRQAIAGINSMQLQAQGTIGGELCQRAQCWFFRNGYGYLADQGRLVEQGDNRYHAIFDNAGPAKFVSGSRTAGALIALGAKVRVIGPQADDERFLPVAELFRTPRHEGQRETVLEPGQLITHVILPAPDGRMSATYEVRTSEGPDYPLTSAAVSLFVQGNVIRDAVVTLGLVAPKPWISHEAAAVLRGRTMSVELAEEAGLAAVEKATPLSGNAYKVQLAKVAVKRALLKAAHLDCGGFSTAEVA